MTKRTTQEGYIKKGGQNPGPPKTKRPAAPGGIGESMTSDERKAICRHAQDAFDKGHDSQVNPFPDGTEHARIWDDAFVKAVVDDIFHTDEVPEW